MLTEPCLPRCSLGFCFPFRAPPAPPFRSWSFRRWALLPMKSLLFTLCSPVPSPEATSLAVFYSVSRSYPQLSCCEHTTLKVCLLFKQSVCVNTRPLSPGPEGWVSAMLRGLSFHARGARGPCLPSGLGTEPHLLQSGRRGQGLSSLPLLPEKLMLRQTVSLE